MVYSVQIFPCLRGDFVGKEQDAHKAEWLRRAGWWEIFDLAERMSELEHIRRAFPSFVNGYSSLNPLLDLSLREESRPPRMWRRSELDRVERFNVMLEIDQPLSSAETSFPDYRVFDQLQLRLHEDPLQAGGWILSASFYGIVGAETPLDNRPETIVSFAGTRDIPSRGFMLTVVDSHSVEVTGDGVVSREIGPRVNRQVQFEAWPDPRSVRQIVIPRRFHGDQQSTEGGDSIRIKSVSYNGRVYSVWFSGRERLREQVLNLPSLLSINDEYWDPED